MHLHSKPFLDFMEKNKKDGSICRLRNKVLRYCMDLIIFYVPIKEADQKYKVKGKSLLYVKDGIGEIQLLSLVILMRIVRP